MPDARVSPRERLVLTAIIEIYIATGEPVASREVARFFANREGLSPATIRNVMATLGETGLLEQPHTSAGRVPTAAAFRYYVEQITQPDAQMGPMAAGASSLNAMPPGRSSLGSTRFDSRAFGASPLGPQLLSETRRGQIEESFSGVASTNDYLERTSHVLALLSSGLGVALASATAGQVLEHIHFSRLSTGRVLAVLVTQAGAVQDRVLALDRELTHVELETAARYLNENFRGWLIERIRAEVARRLELEQEAYHQMLASIEELCRKGALAGGEAGPAIFVDGMANLIAAEVDRERLRQMLLALEAKQRLVELLTAYVDGRQQEVRVVVGLDLAGHDSAGLDEASQAMRNMVLIGAPARLGGANLGTVAVIAPTRIQYQEMIQAVRYIARLSERLLEDSAG
jgi:heat-inducible transcriptional repressor